MPSGFEWVRKGRRWEMVPERLDDHDAASDASQPGSTTPRNLFRVSSAWRCRKRRSGRMGLGLFGAPSEVPATDDNHASPSSFKAQLDELLVFILKPSASASASGHLRPATSSRVLAIQRQGISRSGTARLLARRRPSCRQPPSSSSWSQRRPPWTGRGRGSI